MRRPTLAALGCLTVTGLLSGCNFTYDVTPPVVSYENRLDQDVVVSIEGEGSPFERTIKSDASNDLGTKVCLGTAIVVQAGDGELIGRVDEQACPGWTLTINEDGTLDYTEDGHRTN